MKLIAQVKLQPDPQQSAALLSTMEAVNEACNHASQVAWETGAFREYPLRKLVYREIRESFHLGAQLAQQAVAKVADAYKVDRKVRRAFKPHGSVPYDDRVLSWFTQRQEVSIWTLEGRLRIPYQTGERQKTVLQHRKGESDLIYRGGEFYLFATCDLPDTEEYLAEAILGVDLGIVNLASDSDGEHHSGESIEEQRRRHARLRRDLQKRGSLSAKRHLRKLSGKQKRFQKNTNHVIAKKLVAKAERTKRAIALEDLKGIRSRTRVRGREQRGRHGNWSFEHLRHCIQYKAKLAGVPLALVNPQYTSQRCFQCGHVARRNRPSQDVFRCRVCRHIAHADINAAMNIARAAVIRPIVSDALVG